MKRVIICIILFLALCALAAGSYFYIVNTTTRLLNKVELVMHNFAEGSFTGAQEAAGEADRLWTDFRKRRHLIIDRDNVAEITATVARIRSLAERESDEIETECAVAIALINKYLNKQWVSFYNVM
jgi:HAMP domain-containing protein